jgi:adenylate cyclase
MDSSREKLIYSLLINGSISGLLTSLFLLLIINFDAQSGIAGFCIGFFIYFSIYSYKTKIEARYFRNLNLIILLFLNTIIQVLIILIVSVFFVTLIYLEGHFEIIFSESYSILFRGVYLIGLLYGLVLSMIFSFLSIVSTIIGKNMLSKLFIGKYRKPLEEERIFMFLDILSSTMIAEKVGHLSYLSFLNDFFYDVSEPITRTHGEIYKYVGDEVIISWKMKSGLKENNCIRCFLYIDEVIKSRSGYYIKKYGLVPEFKAGLHGGLAVIGELGLAKREIAYIGDVVNTTARIESECNNLDRRLLISQDLAGLLDLTGLEEVGTVKLRGKEKEMKLFSYSVK